MVFWLVHGRDCTGRGHGGGQSCSRGKKMFFIRVSNILEPDPDSNYFILPICIINIIKIRNFGILFSQNVS